MLKDEDFLALLRTAFDRKPLEAAQEKIDDYKLECEQSTDFRNYVERVRADEREACAKCRDFVEILPGEMPDDLFEMLSSDKDTATECLRIVVRQTLDEYEAAIRARKEKE